MAKAPYFKFYPQDFLTGVLDYTAEEIGAYILLLIYQWDKGFVPSDQKKIKGICKISEKKFQKILEKFTETSAGKLQNLRLETERKKVTDFYNKQAEKASKGGRPPQNKNPRQTHGKTIEEKPTGNPSLSQPEPYTTNVVLSEPEPKDTNVSRAHTPTLQQVQEMFWQMGVQDDAAAQHFFGHYEARGWCTDQGTPFKSIKGLVMSWMNNPIASKQVTAAPSPAVAAYQQSYNPLDPKYRD